MLHGILKMGAPVLGLALAASLAGCDGRVSISGSDGVPLSELDLTGSAPTELVLAGPDTVFVSEGDALKIDVSGDAAATRALRFELEDGTLSVMRENGDRSDGKATVRVTMPAVRKLTLAGSGDVQVARAAGEVELIVAGSGTARVSAIEADELEVTVAGSGTLEASGRARQLDLTVAGSGSARMNGLRADRADVSIAGSGDASFASDGTVEASIMGSGTVTVAGNAKCTVEKMGSGKLQCTGASPAGSTPAAGPSAGSTPPAEARPAGEPAQ